MLRRRFAFVNILSACIQIKPVTSVTWLLSHLYYDMVPEIPGHDSFRLWHKYLSMDNGMGYDLKKGEEAGLYSFDHQWEVAFTLT